MIMACATGKTFTTLSIKEALEAHTTLVLLPSLSLLSQTRREWAWAGNTHLCKTQSNTGPQKRRMTRLSRSKNPPVCVLHFFGGREMYSVDIYSLYAARVWRTVCHRGKQRGISTRTARRLRRCCGTGRYSSLLGVEWRKVRVGGRREHHDSQQGLYCSYSLGLTGEDIRHTDVLRVAP